MAVAVCALLPAGASAVPPRSLAGFGTVTFDRSPFGNFPSSGQSSSGLISFVEGRTKRHLLIQITGSPNYPLTQDHPKIVGAPVKVVHAEHASGRCKVGSTGDIQARSPSKDFPTPEVIILTINDCGLGEIYDNGHAGTHMEFEMHQDSRSATPWSSEFRFSVYTPGAHEIKPPKEPKLEIDHQMQSRIFTDLNGFLRFPETRDEIAPPDWLVDFSTNPCDRGDYSWTIDGAPYKSQSCHLKARVGHLGAVNVSVTHGAASASSREVLKDRLVLGLGDSLASGEGVPDQGLVGGHDKVVWANQQCHRSARSHQALTAQAIARKDRSSSMTFVHLACSGAAFASGLFGSYGGIDPSAGSILAGQFTQFRSISGGRKPDVVLVAIGVNHAHFGGVLKYCTVVFQSVRDNCRESHVVWDQVAEQFNEDSSGPTLEDYVDEKLKELPSMYRGLNNELDRIGVNSNRVYIVVYPDPTRTRDGHTYCKDFLEAGPGGVASIDPEDTRWLALHYALPLNGAVSAAARRYGWNLVKGYADEFYEHGYCAGNQRWTVTFSDSEKNQGDNQGTVHPNYTGHREIAKYEVKSVIDDLFPPKK